MPFGKKNYFSNPFFFTFKSLSQVSRSTENEDVYSTAKSALMCCLSTIGGRLRSSLYQ